MNLYQHLTKLQALSDELYAQGIQPSDVDVIGVVGSSGSPYEIGSASIRRADGEDRTVEDILDLEPGQRYIHIYLGN